MPGTSSKLFLELFPVEVAAEVHGTWGSQEQEVFYYLGFPSICSI